MGITRLLTRQADAKHQTIGFFSAAFDLLQWKYLVTVLKGLVDPDRSPTLSGCCMKQ